MPYTTPVTVVGMTFHDGYPDNMHRLSDILEQERADEIRAVTGWADLNSNGREGPTVILRRAPDNRHDANAIEVHIPLLGRDGFVGHIPRALAARWAPKLDAGHETVASVVAIPIDPDHPEKPSLHIEVTVYPPGQKPAEQGGAS